ncbi:MAG: TadE/TadG family type IV pilus assembly protein [Thermoguttaceae bacterium]
MSCCDKPVLLLVSPEGAEARRRHVNRRGQSLVEFAVVALVVYMLLAAILTFGQLLYCSQGIQQAADVAARELARTPLPAIDTFSMALSDTGVQARIYDERYLVLTIDANPGPNGTITYNNGYSIVDLPLVNQQLIPLMVSDWIGTQPVLRYPGAVFTDTNAGAAHYNPVPPSGYLVRIPVVGPPSASGGGQTIGAWLSPVEPILDSAQNDAFSVAATTNSGMSGTVALRINYPYQSASMSGFVPPTNATSPPGPPDNPVVPIIADNGITSSGTLSGVGGPVTTQIPGQDYDPNGGTSGLGQQAAWGQTVRPYRSVISAQAIYRREVFQ